MIRSGVLGPAVLLIAGCDIVLGIPNPDEVRSVEDVGRRLCECPNLVQQGQIVVGSCEAGVAEGGEDALVLLAEADCTDCGNAGACYALATGASKAGATCESHGACASFACCATDFANVVGSQTTITLGACCDACAGCNELFASGVDWETLSGVCVESADVFAGPGIVNQNNLIVALGACLCVQGDVGGCIDQGACPPTAGGAEGCLPAVASGTCRDCLFATAGNACQQQDNACRADTGRPR